MILDGYLSKLDIRLEHRGAIVIAPFLTLILNLPQWRFVHRCRLNNGQTTWQAY